MAHLFNTTNFHWPQFNLYHSLGNFSRGQIGEIFLIFPRKQDLIFYANWKQFAWNVKSCFLGKNKKNISICCLLKFLPIMLSINCYVSQRMTKPTVRLVCPMKNQISLPIHAGWSDSLLIAMCLLQLPGYPKRDEQESLPYWVDVQADLSLCWSHRPYCRFCHVLAEVIFNNFYMIQNPQLLGKNTSS